MNNIFPWLEEAWMRLAARRGALPHAILLQGRSGLGKTELARRFAQGLLCEQASERGEPCGACVACGWFVLGNHPDFRQVEPEALGPAAEEEEGARAAKGEALSKQIRIDQVRALQGFLSVGAHRGGLRIVLVRPAEAMNAATANALLKSLEEPGDRTLFLLVTSQAQRLLPTIRSRCQTVQVGLTAREVALDWLRGAGLEDPEAALAFCGGAPLDAVEAAGSSAMRERLVAELSGRGFEPLAAADRCAAVDAGTLVDTLQKWIFDLAAVAAGLPARYHPREAPVLRQLSPSVDRRALLRFWRELARARAVSQHPLNPRLFMEDLFIRYAALREGVHA